ncbi:MAG: AI-2E family transporter [Haliscomenobacter sp.]|nr:AI-2E family transporter [Haliscomenobacter sp.]
MRGLKVASWMFVVALSVGFLVAAKHLLIPIVIAFTFFYLIITVSDLFRRIPLGRFRLPVPLTTTAAAVAILGVVFLCVRIVVETVERMILLAPKYQKNLEHVGIDLARFMGWEEFPSRANIIKEFDLRSVAVQLGASLSNLAETLILVTIYVLFLLIEKQYFHRKLAALFPESDRYQKVRGILEHIDESVRTYIVLRTITSLLKGFLSYLVLAYVGLDFAVFWAFLIFLLNYIPSLGPIFATSLAALFSLMQFQDVSLFLFILLTIMAIELSIGHYLEPRLVGHTLNLSPFVILFSLSLWGSIWGVIGMFLCVPLMVTIVITLAGFPETRPVALVLSEKGKVTVREEKIPRASDKEGQ